MQYDNDKPRILVALGGRSSEREISINSGKNVAIALEKLGYPVGIIDIGTGNLLQIPELDSLEKDPKKLPEVSNIPLVDIKRHFSLVFIAMHGAFGEDGGLQALLDDIKMPYTGSGAFASALAMDKEHSKIVFRAEQIPTLLDQIVKNAEEKITIKFPVVIKAINQGSSVGVYICENEADAKLAIKQGLEYSDEVMVEPFVKAKELTVAVIDDENGQPKALPVIEIIPKNHKFFDFAAKYDGSTEEVCPAKISDALAKKAQELAVKSYRALGCRHFARVDMVVDERDNIFVLEVNTIPGMTNESLTPKAAQTAGMSFESFIEYIVKIALK